MQATKSLTSKALLALALFTAPTFAASIDLTSANVGSTFTILLDGNVAGQNVSNLTGKANITLTGLSGNTATFDVTLYNTSSSPVTSRISGFGFDTDATISSASVTGVFANAVLNAGLPNNAGSLDVCFTNGNTCQGGGGTGIASGSSGMFSATLNFASNLSSLDLSDFKVRYQSITGVAGGNSGTGMGYLPPNDPPGGVPEPGTYLLCSAGLAGIGLFRRRK